MANQSEKNNETPGLGQSPLGGAPADMSGADDDAFPLDLQPSEEIDRLRRAVSDLQAELLDRGSHEDLTLLRRRLNDALLERRIAESRHRLDIQRLEQERLRLRERIGELESQIVQMIERSTLNETATRAVRDEYEARLALELSRVEGDFLNRLRSAEEEWNRERQRLLDDIERLKARKSSVA